MSDHIPEDVIVKILQRLPIKSLIRFSCVSKRWRFLILLDPQFAKTQFQMHQTFRHRVLVNEYGGFNSVDLKTPSSPVRELHCPFNQPVGIPRILCSCNGLVCATFDWRQSNMYIWNPTTAFFKKLPDPGYESQELIYYGFGYVSAADDYKVITCNVEQVDLFSSRSNMWKKIETSASSILQVDEGTLFNETLHWLDGYNFGIVAFDLAEEEFRTMELPTLDDDVDNGSFRCAGSVGGCLCVLASNAAGSVDLWVMREYDVGESWTKLFHFEVSNLPAGEIPCFRSILVTGTSTFLETQTDCIEWGRVDVLIKCSHCEEEPETFRVSTRPLDAIAYEESLLWLND